MSFIYLTISVDIPGSLNTASTYILFLENRYVCHVAPSLQEYLEEKTM
jgi:hypothetical protein